jgi:hypothetical protein
MTIDGATIVAGVTPRLSRQRFARILVEHGSPAAQGDPGHGWDVVRQHGIDPAFALALFHQESQFATDPDSAVVRHGLRNPGHTRSSRTGVGAAVQTVWGAFVRYPSWAEGWRDLAFRLVDPTYDYAVGRRRAIRPILELWAPEDDPHAPPGVNVTDRYVARVVANMTAWVDLPQGGQPTPAGPGACAPLEPPPFDGSDKHQGAVLFRADRRTVTAAVDDLPCRRFADPAACQTRPPLRRGEAFEALYWVEGEEVAGSNRWWVARGGSRIWGGGTVPRPGEAE